MFIPIWVLVIVAIVLVVGLPRLLGAVFSAAIVGGVLLLVASFLGFFYFYLQGDRQTAFIVGIPLYPVIAWELLKETSKVMRSSLWLHQFRAKSATTPEALIRLRQRYADDISLGTTLFEFYDDIKHFPSWFNARNPDGTPWTSNVINQDAIIECQSRFVPDSAGIDGSLLTSDSGRPCLIYSFAAGGREFAFCARVDGYADTPGRRRDGLYKALAVWVIEKPNNVALKADLQHHCGEYRDSFESAYFHAFKPGEWLEVLIDTATAVKADEKAKHEQWQKQRDSERAASFK